MDRKYRQSGYQDNAPRTGGSSREGERPTRLEGAPRGRGVDPARDEVFRCKRCGERQSSEFTPEAVCVRCKSPLHACQQCAHFDTAARFQCRKEIPAPIPSKTKANDCTLFAPAIVMDLKPKSAAAAETPDSARAAFDRLFKK